MEEKKNTIDGLLEQGKAAGKLTTKEISDALEEMDFDLDQLNSFYDTCEQLNIEIHFFPLMKKLNWHSVWQRAIPTPRSGCPKPTCVW